MSNADAALALGQPVTVDQLAADGSTQGNAFCAGDVGSPLVVDGASGKKLVGVASYNLGCSAPNMFARASYFQGFIDHPLCALRRSAHADEVRLPLWRHGQQPGVLLPFLPKPGDLLHLRVWRDGRHRGLHARRYFLLMAAA